jgi:hypothetical protein
MPGAYVGTNRLELSNQRDRRLAVGRRRFGSRITIGLHLRNLLRSTHSTGMSSCRSSAFNPTDSSRPSPDLRSLSRIRRPL